VRQTLAWFSLAALVLSGCGGSGNGTAPSPPGVPTPTPSPTSTPVNAAFTCPTSDTVASVARSAGVAGEAVRRAPLRYAQSPQAAGGLIAVSYDRATAQRSAAAIATRETSAGTKFVREFDFPNTGTVMRILSVAPENVASVESALRSQPGVRSVGPAGGRRRPSTVTEFFPNDPYFKGFNSPVKPYYETNSSPGQWDMHAIGLESAFGYSGKTSGTGAKIAIIDTGVDVSHPELSGKVAYQKCFLTAPDGTTKSESSFSPDQDGHGTDVAGIAAASLDNGIGFAGAGGNAQIYAYRIFPTPDDNCLNTSTTDAQCFANTADIAAAIGDAVAQHVDVINLSLGDIAGCLNGVDSASDEGAAISEALAANIVVVAAAGNDGGSAIQAPACVTNVIAVGASSLADGQPNGSGNSSGSEYVASYSDSGAVGANVHNVLAWGIVAPGGDPISNSDSDYLHWIENVWTSTPFDPNFASSCVGDYGGTTADCRTLIAGTSMSAPHVAGAAALIISTNLTTFKSLPSGTASREMKRLLCANAHDISDQHQGCGRLNVYRALANFKNDTPLPPL
jgi:hypothetical protein